MIHDTRIHILTDEKSANGRYVLYWMQQSQRARFNHALEYAIREANDLRLPVLVAFGLMDDYPEANERHYAFMLEGLRDVRHDLKQRGIRFIVRRGNPPEVAVDLAKDAALVVCDRGYLRHQRRWRDYVADHAGRRVVEVESDAVVPVEEASDKQEYAARTLRPKIHRKLAEYLVDLKSQRIERGSMQLRVAGDLDVSHPKVALKSLRIDRSVTRSTHFIGGSQEAERRLKAFLRYKLPGYATGRNEPAAGQSSTLSPYLHFGQLSPLELALRVSRAKDAPTPDREAFLEELIVRRELAINFCFYCNDYDSYDCLPKWAQTTLKQHAADERPAIYSLKQLESAQTGDRFWNAAQTEMTKTGYMHNYMRMYWGKKIIEWTRTPQQAYQTALHLNNKYFLDGRDPNAYANVAWLFGLHDRPWGPARNVFGTVRYMNEAGLRRKFDMEAYVERVGELR